MSGGTEISLERAMRINLLYKDYLQSSPRSLILCQSEDQGFALEKCPIRTETLECSESRKVVESEMSEGGRLCSRADCSQ